MIESIVLDILLVLVMFLMMAIGAYRGGLREAFSAAGLILGVLIATEWLDSWGGWLARNTSLSEGGARFLIAVITMLVVTIAVGYGVGSSFNYHPGPGGRMFGSVLAAGFTLVAISYVLTWLRVFLFDEQVPEVVQNTYIARFLDGDAGFVLLAVSCIVVVSALFGSFARERDDDSASDAVGTSTPVTSSYRPPSRSGSDFPEKVEPASGETKQRTAPIRVREAQHWEDRSGSMPSRKDRLWSNTWPSDAPGIKSELPARSKSDVRQARERHRRDGDGPTQSENDQ